MGNTKYDEFHNAIDGALSDLELIANLETPDNTTLFTREQTERLVNILATVRKHAGSIQDALLNDVTIAVSNVMASSPHLSFNEMRHTVYLMLSATHRVIWDMTPEEFFSAFESLLTRLYEKLTPTTSSL